MATQQVEYLQKIIQSDWKEHDYIHNANCPLGTRLQIAHRHLWWAQRCVLL